MSEKERIVIAMSGGVDSSVAAALLVEQGFSVSGVMLKLWSDEQTCAENSCCPPEAIAQARQVAGQLGIPFYVLDVREQFKREIVDEFITAYKSGITPNPCFSCNKNIRWGFMLDRVLSTGVDRIATGHYARIENDNGVFRLKKGNDPLKDQSYVLSGLDQRQLEHSVFPLGELRKTEVREIARSLKIPVAEKHDSQDLCFVGKSGYRDFLMRHSPKSFKVGNIRMFNGEVIGQHNGLENYTIGQRKGLGAGFSKPIYVIDKDTSKNEIIVGYEENLGCVNFSARIQEWTPSIPLHAGLRCEVKTRYKSALRNAKIAETFEDKLVVTLEEQQRDITPGQIAVFYQDEYVLGSAVIESRGFAGEKK
jgi:tRNA-specific 2-thiouridylase